MRCKVILHVFFFFLNVDKAQVYVDRNAIIIGPLEQHLGRKTDVKKSAVRKRIKNVNKTLLVTYSRNWLGAKSGTR